MCQCNNIFQMNNNKIIYSTLSGALLILSLTFTIVLQNRYYFYYSLHLQKTEAYEAYITCPSYSYGVVKLNLICQLVEMPDHTYDEETVTDICFTNRVIIINEEGLDIDWLIRFIAVL